MAAYIHDLIGTWWSRGGTGTPQKVTEVRYALEGHHLARIGTQWASVTFSEDGLPTMVDRAWVRRKPLPPPTWVAPLELAAEYIAKARESTTNDWLAPQLFDDLERMLAETWSDLHAGPTPRP